MLISFLKNNDRLKKKYRICQNIDFKQRKNGKKDKENFKKVFLTKKLVKFMKQLEMQKT